jgi:hypothetical protein
VTGDSVVYIVLEIVERSFAHVLDGGGMRCAWLRGCENLHKRNLVHVAGFNLGVLMPALFGYGTPRENVITPTLQLYSSSRPKIHCSLSSSQPPMA